jgi:proteasome lid subunit RPN8/RPN11
MHFLAPRSPRRPRTDRHRMTRSAYTQLMAILAAGPPERGAWGFGRPQDGVIRRIHFDHAAACTAVTYSPDVQTLALLLTQQYAPAGEELRAIYHSHPGGLDVLSSGDLEYARTIFAANPAMTQLSLPLVTVQQGSPVLHPYVVERAGDTLSVRKVPLELYDEPLTASSTAHSFAARGWWRRLTRQRQRWWEGEAFSRIREAVDLELLAHSSVFIAGLGSGGMRLALQLARCGVGHFVVVDPDVVSLANLATQDVRRADLFAPKASVARRAIRAINPHAKVTALQADAEGLGAEQIAKLCGRSQDAARIVLCALTDSFRVQAHLNRAALSLELPSIQSQIYERGLGGEVTFTMPGVTPACHACLLKERYQAYERGFHNTVSADGALGTASMRLQALCTSVVLMLLHHGSGHHRWDGLLQAVADRNLVQVRLDPRLDHPLFAEMLDARASFFDEPLWLHVPPNPACPDCGSTGRARLE